MAKTESLKKEAEVIPEQRDQPGVMFKALRQESNSKVAKLSVDMGIEMMNVLRYLEEESVVVMERIG